MKSQYSRFGGRLYRRQKEAYAERPGDSGHAEIDVADDAVAVVLSEVQRGYSVLQLFLADGGLTTHAFSSF